MNDVMKHLCLLLLLIAATSCRSEKNSRGEFFSGMFTCYANQATFTDCATGMTVPVCSEGAYSSLEQRYFRTISDPTEAVYVELRGRMNQQPRREGDGMESVMTIDSLITLDRTIQCNPQYLLVGVYEAQTDQGRRLLRLKPNYEFTETKFTANGEESSSGRWWRSAELELVLEERSPGMSEQSFQLIPPQETLSRNSGEGPLVYKKVYL